MFSLNFFVYWSLSKLKKVSQEQLTIEEKYALAIWSDKAKYLHVVLSSLQMIIFYLQNTFTNESYFGETINTLPAYINIDYELREFANTRPHLQLKKLVEIYEYLEFLCFNKILENVNLNYLEKLSDGDKKAVDSYFNKQDLFINKGRLATAPRRFILRYLIREEEISKDITLIERLIYKPDFWEKSVNEDERMEEEGVEMFF